jgi:hypothetical protein
MVVFLSHSSKDVKFVNLLDRLLTFYNIPHWYSPESLAGGQLYATEIVNAVSDADKLLLVLSNNAVSSKWVAEEVRIFRTHRPSGQVIPLLLEEISDDQMKALNVDGFQYVDFSTCWATGFDRLFQRTFGTKFLSIPKSPRGPERRKADAHQRLRVGFLKAYEQVTRTSKFSELDLPPRKLADVLKAEAEHFIFYDRKQFTEMDVNKVLYAVICEEISNTGGLPTKAVYVVENIADRLWERYEVRNRERRTRPAGLGLQA